MDISILEKIKLFAEAITSTATALVVVIHFFKLCIPIKNFLKITVPLFFKGYTKPDGKKIRFFKGIKLKQEENLAIIKAISTDFEMEDALVLDKKALFDIISNSKAFQTIRLRKK